MTIASSQGFLSTGQVVRDLARVLVGQKRKTVIDVTEESKPVLEAFLSDVYRKYNARKKAGAV
jgi:hypothetical protein